MFRQKMLYPASWIKNQNYTTCRHTELSSQRFFNTNKNIKSHLEEQKKLENDKIIKASFTKCSEAERQLFKSSNCLVTLSIGQPVHTGDYLAATLAEVNRSFKTCTLVLGDTLQRHTLALTRLASEKELHKLTKENGDQWLRDNFSTLAKLTIPWKVTRWDNWLENEKYQRTLSMIQNTYLQDAIFKQAFDTNIDDFIARVKNRNQLIIDEKSAKEFCLSYLSEECAVMCLWIDEKCQFELYASGRTLAMQATFERYTKIFHPELLHPLAMRFKKVNSFEKDEITNNIPKLANVSL